MKNFAAIDFETANNERSSVCSVGIVIVRDGEITHRHYALIRPEPNYYTVWTTNVHGMTRKDTDDARTFPEVWNEISPFIAELPLVAHNSPFDEGCLRAAFERYGMDYPGYIFHCTCRASRRHHRHLDNHKLPTVSAACGYDLSQHHQALADAEACAIIAMKILSD